MINEAKIRSPKWLRNFVDFEISTGDDIDDKKKERLEKERLEKEQERKREQKRLSNEIISIHNKVVSDWNSAKYNDKISTYRVSGKVVVEYKFENGSKLKFGTNKLSYDKYTYTLATKNQNMFIDLFNIIINYSNKYNNRRNPGSGYSSSNRGYDSNSSKSNSKSSSSSSNYSNHPKGNLYKTLLDTIKSREDQLRKMSRYDTDRSSLENELKIAKEKAASMRSKYKFENVMSFDLYIQQFG